MNQVVRLAHEFVVGKAAHHLETGRSIRVTGLLLRMISAPRTGACRFCRSLRRLQIEAIDSDLMNAA
jgi:hypothetical protein